MATTVTKTRIFESFQKDQSLPVSGPKGPQNQGLRKRLSSLSLRFQPISRRSSSWDNFRRSKSIPAFGEFAAGASLRKWWDWGWARIMSRKPTFAKDLEMNEEENTKLGLDSKGSWRHVFFKVRSEFRKLVGSHQLPTTQKFRYDSFSYAQNLVDGKRSEG